MQTQGGVWARIEGVLAIFKPTKSSVHWLFLIGCVFIDHEYGGHSSQGHQILWGRPLGAWVWREHDSHHLKNLHRISWRKTTNNNFGGTWDSNPGPKGLCLHALAIWATRSNWNNNKQLILYVIKAISWKWNKNARV